jgi:heme A synthase
MKGYPRRFVAVLWTTIAATWVSGVLLAPTTLALRGGAELPWRLAAAARVGVVTLHVAAALVLVAVCGALWSVHMRAGWRQGRQRASGTTTATLMVALAATGIAVLYAGSERLADAAALLHLGAGAALVAPLAWHRATPSRAAQVEAGNSAA